MTVKPPVYDAERVVLQTLADGPLSAYEIGRRCEGRVVGSSLTWLYPLLNKLEVRGAITGRWQIGDRGRRRCYAILGSRRKGFAGPIDPADSTATAWAPDTGSIARSGSASTYLDRVARAMTLPSGQVEEIRHELEDHLEDAGILEPEGSGPGSAARAERLLGQPEQLAGAIVWVRRERQTFWRTVLTNVALAPALLFFSAVAAAFCLSFVRLVVYLALRFATAAAAASGTLSLDQRQLAFPLVVGAFIAGRYMAGRVLALGTRRSVAAVGFAVAVGAALLGVPALILQTDLDLVSGAVLVAIPMALIAGAIRPMRYSQRLVSVRGIVAAVALGFAVIGLPINGLLVYSVPGGVSNARAVRVETTGESDHDTAGWGVVAWLDDPGHVTGVCLEVQPVVRHGWFLDIDPATAGFSGCQTVKPGIFEFDWFVPAPKVSGREWLVLVTSLDDGGQRHLVSVNMDLVVPYRGSILGWLTGQPGG